jgi:hypothetical protein
MFARLFISSPFFRISCKKCARHEQRTRATHEQRKRQGRARAIYANCFANVDAFTEVCTETKGTTLLIEQAGRYINGGSLDRAHRSTRSCADIGGMAAATAVLFPLVSTPPLMLLIMRMTNSPAIMGTAINGEALNVLGWTTTAAIFAATAALVATWVM